MTGPPEISLAQRKAEFLDATKRLDPLASLRQHPFVTVGTAIVMGLTVGSPHLAVKVKAAKGHIATRLLKAVVMRVAQHFVESRAAKMYGGKTPANSPQAAEASA